MCWAKGYAALAVNAILIFTADGVGFCIVAVGFVCTLINAYFATYATVLVTFNKVFRDYVSFH
jgi:hypothetical protein